jgi:hypothetical protein|tara:strand:+ start:644 stop:1357 length:714 start_codon:yes stop_codon:yes gene_type:complete
MKILNFIKNNLFLQNFVASIVSYIPPFLEFSIAKYIAIKKAMYITAIDKTYGSYMEFGVFTGSSFNFAMKINKQLEKTFGNTNCEFIGFDSFQGFGKVSDNDKHPFYKKETFSINEKKVFKNIKNMSKGQRMRIVKGFFNETIKNKTTKDLNIDKARVVLIDCDLREPTLMALEFIKPSIQEGTIILFDDYIWFKGSKEKGEYSAFSEFKKKYPKILFRKAFDYGYGSKAFVAYKVG